MHDLQDKKPYVLSINTSKGGIPKQPVESIYVTRSGLEGDAHNHEKHNRPIQAVCLQDMEKLAELQREGYPLYPGATGENLTVCHLHVNDLPVGAILEFPSGLVLEISKARKPCYVLDAIHPQLKEDIDGRCGMYAQVLQEGMITVKDTIKVSRKFDHSSLGSY